MKKQKKVRDTKTNNDNVTFLTTIPKSVNKIILSEARSQERNRKAHVRIILTRHAEDITVQKA